MGLNSRRTEDLTRIAAAGGGFRLDAGPRHLADLTQIAAAARDGNARVTFAGMASRRTEDLVQIAAAGRGAVVFED